MPQRTPVHPALQRLRERLDRVNREILARVQERGELVLEVAALKDELGLDSYDPRREAEMVRELTADPEGPFGAEDLAAIFRALFTASLDLERRSRHPAPAAKAPEPEPETRPHPKIQAIGRR